VIFSNTDLREKIKNIKCPTLVLLEYFKNVKPAIEEQYKKLKNSQHNIQQRTAFTCMTTKNGILAS
jgi:hypothetical protein